MEVLNKSAIVLLVACWEAFVEDLATDAFDYLLQYGHDHTVFPPKLLALATKDVRESQDARAVWRLAGDGWRDVLQAHRQVTLAELVGKVNTPRPRQVDAMFENLLGVRISSEWRWQGMSATSARQLLEDLVILRGDIAHRVTTSRYVYKKNVVDAAYLIFRLAARSSNYVRKFVRKQTGQYPWMVVQVMPKTR